MPTFKLYVEQLNHMLKENPKLSDVDVIYSKDDEGNGFRTVVYGPTFGLFYDGDEFTPAYDIEVDKEPNAICIN